MNRLLLLLAICLFSQLGFSQQRAASWYQAITHIKGVQLSERAASSLLKKGVDVGVDLFTLTDNGVVKPAPGYHLWMVKLATSETSSSRETTGRSGMDSTIFISVSQHFQQKEVIAILTKGSDPRHFPMGPLSMFTICFCKDQMGDSAHTTCRVDHAQQEEFQSAQCQGDCGCEQSWGIGVPNAEWIVKVQPW
ncbi:hypothetical protein [Pontibacter sp. G13]|uniref:hypothetical protein n=1 Tax=Pontibacter sp. G13 TaxID=3074898 RepID=UPI0028895336|nr:hypothetical protein [Pontibacter sp. G13]WNJ18294.1 hypothetical protein RJD25_25865 [Pontibacter sp. G13]